MMTTSNNFGKGTFFEVRPSIVQRTAESLVFDYSELVKNIGKESGSTREYPSYSGNGPAGNQHQLHPMFSFYSDSYQGFSPILIKP